MNSWGKTPYGKKRYRCPRCLTSITAYKKKKTSFFGLFKQYILWGLTYEILSYQSGYSVPHLVEKFHEYLEQDPPPLPKLNQSRYDVAYLLIDGLWLARYFVLMVYRQSKNLVILHISVAGGEYTSKIKKDLDTLKVLGYRFSGIVSDGGKGVVSAIREVFPYLAHQICLFHMYSQVSRAIGKNPQDYRVQELRKLADHVWLIESREALEWWHKQVRKWIFDNHGFLVEKKYNIDGSYWFVHKGVRKAARILDILPQTSFTFLRGHPLMPKTTNEVEAQFGHLGKRWLAHRGLKKERWQKFLNWFVYLYNQDKLSPKKRKSD